MNYYLINQDRRASQVVLPVLNNQQDLWNSDKPIFIPGRVKDVNLYSYFLPFIETPVLMISDPLKKILELYQNKTAYRPCALGIIEVKKLQVYWFMQPKIIKCLKSDIQDNVIYSAEDIILDTQKIGANKVFQLDTVVGTYFIIDQEVLEHMLRAGITEICMTELKTMG